MAEDSHYKHILGLLHMLPGNFWPRSSSVQAAGSPRSGSTHRTRQGGCGRGYHTHQSEVVPFTPESTPHPEMLALETSPEDVETSKRAVHCYATFSSVVWK